MNYIRGISRQLVTLLPEALEDYVTADNPVHFIDAFVARLDLKELGFTHADPAETGWPSYAPGDLPQPLSLISSRALVAVARARDKSQSLNDGVAGKLSPDFKTIADFRKDNRAALKQVCHEFALLWQEEASFHSE